MKKNGEKCLICTLLLVAGLVCLFVGWIVWIKTGDSFTTGLALVMMGISFFIRPLESGNEQHVANELKQGELLQQNNREHKAA